MEAIFFPEDRREKWVLVVFFLGGGGAPVLMDGHDSFRHTFLFLSCTAFHTQFINVKYFIS